MLMAAYRLATQLASPFLGLVLNARARRGKEDPARFDERRAMNLPVRPEGPLVWLHGASVGESQILFELGRRLLDARPDLHLLFTSQTLTSATLLAPRLGPRMQHAMAPVDTPSAAKRFIAHWRPCLAIFGEGEFWPNLIHEAQTSGARLALVNARMTEASARGWSRWRGLFRPMASAFDVMLAADPETAARLTALADRNVVLAGNLKSAAQPVAPDADALANLRTQFVAERRCLLAASTHEGEDALFLDAAANLQNTALIIAPRHPARGDEIEALIRARGLVLARRSRGDEANTGTQVLLADTMGEMGLWFALADAVYLGGGHAPGIGGHNPLEPLRLAKPIYSGPDVFNFASVMTELERLGLMRFVPDSQGLAAAFDHPMVPDPSAIDAYFENADVSMTTTLAALLPLLPKREASA